MIELLEPFVSSATSSLTSIAVDIARNGGGKLLQTYKDKSAISAASNQYASKYAERHTLLRILGMREPVSLESVYTEVQVLSEWESQRITSIEMLEEAFQQNPRRGYLLKDVNKQDGLSVAKEHQYLMILGEPGSGKSTFLKKMGLDALAGQKKNGGDSNNKRIPVFVELKRFKNREINIKKLILEEFEICGFPSATEFVETAIDNGSLLILMDGLDEVPSNRVNEVVTHIRDFVDQYDKNSFIISCRTAATAYRSSFDRFTEIVLAEFDDNQIKKFIERWFQSELDKQEETAQKCWSLLQEPEHAAAKELAHRPLLLTLICLVYDQSQNLPDKRSVLYRKALDILLEKWAAEKRVVQNDIYKGFNVELEKILLSEIAYKGFKYNQFFFTEEELTLEIKKFLANTLNAPKHLNGKAVLEAIVIQQGILVERAEYIFSFSHLTLQEYLTAKYLTQDSRQIYNLVTQHLADKRWHEIFLLVSGLIASSDDLLLQMRQQAQNYISSSQANALLHWAEQVTIGSEKNMKYVAKRVAAVYLALEVICSLNPKLTIESASIFGLLYKLHPALAKRLRAILVQNISNEIQLAQEIAKYFASKKMFSNVNLNLLLAKLEAFSLKNQAAQSHSRHRLFSKPICDIWLEVLKLEDKIINISPKEMEQLNKYFYTNSLIIKCQKESMRITPKIWKSIEDKMLIADS
jgi:energy-coupling factor transporter ATP-binding protein EcfA2